MATISHLNLENPFARVAIYVKLWACSGDGNPHHGVEQQVVPAGDRVVREISDNGRGSPGAGSNGLVPRRTRPGAQPPAR